MARATTRTPQTPTPEADPLADLRPPADAPTDREQEQAAGGEPGDQIATAVYDADWHAAANAQIVAAFHQDTVATGALHKGGTCACRYLARLALTASLGLPVQREEPAEEEGEQETDGDG